jgi:hypothetical protein
MSLVITALGVLIAAFGVIIHSVCFGSRGVLGNLPTNRVLRDSCRFRGNVFAPGTSIPEATSPRRAIDNIATSLLPRTWFRWRVIHTRVHRGRKAKRRLMGRRWRDKCRCRPAQPHQRVARVRVRQRWWRLCASVREHQNAEIPCP